MTPTSRILALGFLGGLSLLAGAAIAQQQRPPAPDLAKAAAALDLPESALTRCLGAAPAAGARPAPPDAGKIADCLAKAGHRVDATKVDAALAKAAPPRR